MGALFEMLRIVKRGDQNRYQVLVLVRWSSSRVESLVVALKVTVLGKNDYKRELDGTYLKETALTLHIFDILNVAQYISLN
jgi:hypothetical protein